MNPRLQQLLRLIFILLDLVMLNMMFFLSSTWVGNRIPLQFELYYYKLWIFFNILWLVIGWGNSIYQGHNISTFEVFSRKTTKAYSYFVAGALVYLYFNRQDEISRIFIFSVLVAIGAGLLLNRLIYLILFQYFRRKEYLMRKIIIIGYNEISKKFVNYLEEQPLNIEIVGFCEKEENVHELSHYPIVGEIQNIMETSLRHEVTEIYSTIAPEQDHTIYKLMQQADHACIRFKIIPDLNFFIRYPVHIDYMRDIPVISIRREPLDDIANRIRKRFYDLIFSSLVIIFILTWMIPIVGLLIWLENRGPIFFLQKRSGKDNKPFFCIKFRSMKVNHDANQKQAIRGDRRITKVGAFLRRTNLDEFPQFLNVFMSEMSIVGPRPHMLKHTNDYSKLINKYMVRQFLKPGITGWSQVNGFRGETRTVEDMKKRVENDLWYMENWSLWLDTKIMLLTAFNMFKGDQNAF